MQDVVVSPSLTQEELSLDPLATLRCHQAVFRSGIYINIYGLELSLDPLAKLHCHQVYKLRPK